MPFATLVFLSFFSRFTFFSLFPFTYIDIIFIFLIFSRDGIKRIYRHGILYRIYGGCSDISAADAQYESRRDESERYRRKSGSSESFFRAQLLHDKTNSGRDIMSERITYGKVKGERVFERNIEISLVARVIRSVQAIAEIAADHHHADVDTQTDSRSQRYVAQERTTLEKTVGTHRIIFQKPDITGIYKGRAMQHTDDGEPVFRVKFKLEGTGLVKISVFVRFRRTITPRAD